MNNEPLSKVSDKEFDKLYKLIKKRILQGKKTTDKPFAVILGGQPGAGKGNVYKYYADNVTSNFVELNCDDYREYHPHFKELYKKYGDADSDYTQDFVSKINKRLVCDLSEAGYNMIIESTLHSQNVSLSINEQLKALNYKVDLCVVGTSKDVSWQGTINRKEQAINDGIQPRAVTREYHDYVCENICNSLSTVYESGKMDNITIFNRNKECLYDMSKTPDVNPSKLLDSIINRTSFVLKKISKNELEKHKSELSGLCQVGCKDGNIILKFNASDKDTVENILDNNQNKLLNSIK